MACTTVVGYDLGQRCEEILYVNLYNLYTSEDNLLSC